MTLTIPGLSFVVLSGVSGSGKSTFGRKHFKPTEILSLDACHGMVSDDWNSQAATKDAFEVLRSLAESLAPLAGEPEEFRKRVAKIIDYLVSRYVFDDGKPLVNPDHAFRTRFRRNRNRRIGGPSSEDARRQNRGGRVNIQESRSDRNHAAISGRNSRYSVGG